jgi:hypothetical protein
MSRGMLFFSKSLTELFTQSLPFFTWNVELFSQMIELLLWRNSVFEAHAIAHRLPQKKSQQKGGVLAQA